MLSVSFFSHLLTFRSVSCRNLLHFPSHIDSSAIMWVYWIKNRYVWPIFMYPCGGSLKEVSAQPERLTKAFSNTDLVPEGASLMQAGSIPNWGSDPSAFHLCKAWPCLSPPSTQYGNQQHFSKISDALITQIPADEEPFCGGDAVHIVTIASILILILTVLVRLVLKSCYSCYSCCIGLLLLT